MTDWMKGAAHAAWVTVAMSCACTPTPAEAGAAYGAQLDACIAANSTRSAIDACRAGVDARWGVSDAGILQEAGR
jgi:hypothetical protein